MGSKTPNDLVNQGDPGKKQLEIEPASFCKHKKSLLLEVSNYKKLLLYMQ